MDRALCGAFARVDAPSLTAGEGERMSTASQPMTAAPAAAMTAPAKPADGKRKRGRGVRAHAGPGRGFASQADIAASVRYTPAQLAKLQTEAYCEGVEDYHLSV